VLRHAITSVQRQTLTDLEMIIVGDACTDDTADVVRATDDRRLRWYNRAENSGSQGLPNNDGVTRARGKYVAYLGHDDLWYPTHLETMVARIEEADAALVHSICLWQGPPEAPHRLVSGFELPGGHEANITLPPTSVLHRRELATDIGGWRDYRDLVQGPDYDFISRAWEAIHAFAATNRLTAFKFPSAWRLNSYRDRPSAQQGEYLERMATEPDFVERELLAALGELSAPLRVGTGAAPGEMVAYWRSLRGLEPQALHPLARRTRMRRAVRRLGRPAKAAVVGLLRRIEAL
jgi:glycosyltransferase involved in cell wall biosynthesis